MKKTTILRSFYNLIVLLLLAAGVYLVVNHFVHFGDGEFTDNATVQRQITPVNTRVSGFIKEIRFEEFQQVHKGDTLVIIEDSEFRLRLAQAEADLANALAGKEVTATGMQTTDQSIRVADAGIEEARVQLDNARREEERYAQLLKDDAVTPQQYDQVHTAYLAAQARYEQATRSIGTLSSAKQEQGHRVKQNKGYRPGPIASEDGPTQSLLHGDHGYRRRRGGQEADPRRTTGAAGTDAGRYS